MDAMESDTGKPKATQVPESIWNFVCPYLSTQDILALCLSCKSAHEYASKCLWEEPSVHFGTGIRSHGKFVAFLQTLRHVRRETREKTRILNLSSLTEDIHMKEEIPSLPKNWNTKLMTQLPEIKQISFISAPPYQQQSKHAMQNLCKEIWFGSPRQSLLALELQRCEALDGHKLNTMIGLYRNLRVLDISFILNGSAAKNREFLTNLSAPQTFPCLRVLRFAHNRLTDRGFCILAEGLRTRLYSLDVSGNALTDGIVPLLLSRFFHRGNNRIPPARRIEVDGAGVETKSETKGDPELSRVAADDDEFSSLPIPETISDWVKYFDSGTTSLDKSYKGGLRCLFVGSNNITVEGMNAILGETRLRMLQCGRLKLPQHGKRPGSLGNEEAMAMEDLYRSCMSLNGNLWGNLRYLKLHHAYITGDSELLDDAPKPQRFRDFGGLSWWPEWSASKKIPIIRPRARWDELENLEVLTLEWIPSFSRRGYMTKALLQFLRDLAQAEKHGRDEWEDELLDEFFSNEDYSGKEGSDPDNPSSKRQRRNSAGSWVSVSESDDYPTDQQFREWAKKRGGRAFGSSLKELRLHISLHDDDESDIEEDDDTLDDMYDPSWVSEEFLEAIGSDDWMWESYTRLRDRSLENDPAIDKAFKEAARWAKRHDMQDLIHALWAHRSFTRSEAELAARHRKDGTSGKASGLISDLIPHWSGRVVIKPPRVVEEDDLWKHKRLVV